jgi:hypothetical protein
MSKTTGPYWVYKRPKTKKFQIILYPASNLPPEVCQNWQRKGFSRFPLELVVFREPATRAAAETGAAALIEYLKNHLTPKNTSPGLSPAKATREPVAGAWLKRLPPGMYPLTVTINAGNTSSTPRFYGKGPNFLVEENIYPVQIIKL